MTMNIYAIDPGWRWQMRFWALVSAGIVLMVSFVPGCEPDDWPYQVALVVGFSAATLFFVLCDRKLGRTIRVDDEGIECTEVSGRTLRIGWSAVEGIVNHMRMGYLFVHGKEGQRLRIEHQFRDVQELVGHIVRQSGRTVQEQ